MTTSTDPAVLASLLSDRDDTIASLRALLKNKEHEIADLTRDRGRLEGRLLAVGRIENEPCGPSEGRGFYADDGCEGACHPEVACSECGQSNENLYTVRTGY